MIILLAFVAESIATDSGSQLMVPDHNSGSPDHAACLSIPATPRGTGDAPKRGAAFASRILGIPTEEQVVKHVESEIEQIQSQYKVDMHQLKVETDQSRSDDKAEMKQGLKELAEIVASEMEKARLKYAAEIDQLRMNHSDDKEELKQWLQEIRSKVTAEFDELGSEVKRIREEDKAEMDSKERTEKKQIASEMEQMRANLMAEINELANITKDVMDKVHSENRAGMRKFEDSLAGGRAETKEVKAELLSEGRKHTEEMKRLVEDKERLRLQDRAELQQQLQAEMEEIRLELARLRKKKGRNWIQKFSATVATAAVAIAATTAWSKVEGTEYFRSHIGNHGDITTNAPISYSWEQPSRKVTPDYSIGLPEISIGVGSICGGMLIGFWVGSGVTFVVLRVRR